MKDIHALLDGLAKAFESRGHMVTTSLLPPYSPEEIVRQTAWFPEALPQSIIDVYSWRNGQPGDAWEETYPFWFRDMSFLSLERAKVEYLSLNSMYGVAENSPNLDLDLSRSFPIASFDGSWLVIPASQKALKSKYQHPVYNVLEGVDLYFYSVESMIRTCTDWVLHPKWRLLGNCRGRRYMWCLFRLCEMIKRVPSCGDHDGKLNPYPAELTAHPSPQSLPSSKWGLANRSGKHPQQHSM